MLFLQEKERCMTMANPIELEIEVPKFPTIEVEVKEKSVVVHKDLLGRDESDQHPMGAITGLQIELNKKATKQSLNEEIERAQMAEKELDERIDNIPQPDLSPYAKKSELASVATSGRYADLDGKPTIPSQASEVHALPDTTKYGASLSFGINPTTYVMTIQLKDQDGNNIGSPQTVDLPLESVVVDGSYDSVNKKIILTLQNGSTIDVPVGDLVSGLQTEITAQNKLDSDLVDDTNQTNKFVTSEEKTTWNGKQDTISDLDTIRSGAALGATAVQPSTLNTELDKKIDKGYAVNDFATNCITEIPQDIKLEVDANGKLVLKSGSVVTYPNGSQYQTTSDSTSTPSAAGQHVVFAQSNGNVTILDAPAKVVSGTTDSLAGTTYHVWFDTTNTSIVRYGSNTTTPSLTGLSLPLAIVTVADSKIQSIDKVFNGFGYIGKTIFAMPDVSGLMPNGFNSDGTLNSQPIKTSALSIYNINGIKSNVPFYIRSNGNIDYYTAGKYHPDINRNESYSENYFLAFECGRLWSNNTGSITGFEIHPVSGFSDNYVGRSKLSYYGTCSTAAATQTKDVVCDGFELKTGVSIRVKFTNNQNYNGNPLLNVNGTGAISIKRYGTTNAGRYEWSSGEVIDFTYDGTNWIINEGAWATTNASGKVLLTNSVTATNQNYYTVSPYGINSLVQNMIEPYPVYSNTNTYAVGDRVRYNYQAWECNTPITTAESWTAAHWTALPAIQDQLDITNNRVSNVVTEIPQDIKLELSNGILTLKSGSVLTYPDGTQYQLTSDQSITNSVNGKHILIADTVGHLDVGYLLDRVGSGSSLPPDNTNYSVFYNSTDGKIYTWQTDHWGVRNCSLILALVTVSNGAISSIDQVFNGCGYIGHHAFVLPDVKGLIGNGFNSDGTLKVISKTVSALVIADMTAGPTYNTVFINTYSGQAGTQVYGGEVDTINDFPSDNIFYYAKKDNMPGRKRSGGVLQGNTATPLAHYTQSNGTITSFNIRPVYRAVTEEMLDNYLTTITGYDSTVAQTLKHAANGEIKWEND